MYACKDLMEKFNEAPIGANMILDAVLWKVSYTKLAADLWKCNQNLCNYSQMDVTQLVYAELNMVVTIDNKTYTILNTEERILHQANWELGMIKTYIDLKAPKKTIDSTMCNLIDLWKEAGFETELQKKVQAIYEEAKKLQDNYKEEDKCISK